MSPPPWCADDLFVEATLNQAGRVCDLCHVAIGTYEPIVFIVADQVVHGSRAAEPQMLSQPGLVTFHRDCFAAR